MSSAKKIPGSNPNKGSTAELDRICGLLRTNPDIRNRDSISYSKRVDVFKGKNLLRLLEEHPKILLVDEKERMKTATSLMHRNYFFLAMKNPNKTERLNKMINAPAVSSFDPKGKYIWIYEGAQTKRNVLLTLVISGFLACCMFPIWPMFMKVGLWYLSVTMLLFMLGFTTVRTIIFVLSWLVGYELWVFPNLFDEELSFTDSFKPAYSCEASEAGQAWSRVLVLVSILAFIYWVATQPTDFDRMLSVQKDFIDDLYSGALLSDKAQSDIDKMDSVHVPTIEELLNEDETGELTAETIECLAAAGEDVEQQELCKELAADAAAAAAAANGDMDELDGDELGDMGDDLLDDIMKDVIDSDPLADETTMR